MSAAVCPCWRVPDRPRPRMWQITRVARLRPRLTSVYWPLLIRAGLIALCGLITSISPNLGAADRHRAGAPAPARRRAGHGTGAAHGPGVVAAPHRDAGGRARRRRAARQRGSLPALPARPDRHRRPRRRPGGRARRRRAGLARPAADHAAHGDRRRHRRGRRRRATRPTLDLGAHLRRRGRRRRLDEAGGAGPERLAGPRLRGRAPPAVGAARRGTPAQPRPRPADAGGRTRRRAARHGARR